MAGASLLTLLDDIATILDDVAAMSKVAARKTAGVLGDDLALNAQQVSGVASERELPVVFAVAMGSLRNKVILVPLAMLISAFIPWAITPLLMCGGLFLCYEGFEKVYHSMTHKQTHLVDDDTVVAKAQADIDDLGAYEEQKIKGAIRTDFVLSAEIIAISLGVAAHMDLMAQFLTLSVIAIVMTFGVYGLVAGIVKIDDLGLYLARRKPSGVRHKLGLTLVSAAPYLMKTLTFVGTIAMFMVGGGILTHGIHLVFEWIEHAQAVVTQINVVGGFLGLLTPSILNALFGVVAGGVVLLAIKGVSKLMPAKS